MDANWKGLNWNEWEGLKVKRAVSIGDLEFAKQNSIPDGITLFTNKGTITIEAMPSEDEGNPRPWLRVREGE